MRKSLRSLLVLVALALGVVVLRAVPTPSNDRDWVGPQARLARSEPVATGVQVHNVRNFRYAPDGSVTVERWEDRTYDPRRLTSVWLGLSRFGGTPGVAHVFLSFGFDDGRYLAASVEARRERDETYHPLRGLARAYEMIEVLGDERDIVGVRANTWHDEVQLYPIRATPDAMRAAFAAVLARADALAARPEFYDTLTNSCSTNVARLANEVVPGLVPTSLRVIFAGLSDGLARDLGLIAFDGSLEEARRRFRINERAAGDVDAGDFSARIRAP